MEKFSPAKIYVSEKIRAVQSGELIAQELGIPFETIGGMHERDWGAFSGQQWSDVGKFLNRMSVDERYTFVPPGGESWQRFETRLIGAVQTLMERHRGENETIVIVSHGGAIRALMPFLLGALKEESFKYDIDNASLTIFDHEDGGAFRRVVINDVSHLSQGQS